MGTSQTTRTGDTPHPCAFVCEEAGRVDKSGLDGEEDPWAILDSGTGSNEKPWKEMSGKEKFLHVLIGVGRVLALLTLLYFFVCSLDLLSLGFRLVGGRTTGDIFRQSDILQNPVVGVMIGVLTTVLVQSSSTSTSIIVSMVSANFLTVPIAIPIVMGANIGTSITNTIVSLTQVGDRNQFRRAFAGATVHDMFNWLTVITLLILEVSTGYLFHLTNALMGGLSEGGTSGGEIAILTVITKPLVNQIVQLNKKVLICWSEPGCTKYENSSLIKEFCKSKSKIKQLNLELLSSDNNYTEYDVTTNLSDTLMAENNSSGGGEQMHPCTFLFAGTSLSDAAVGAIVLVGSLFVLCSCLILIVKVLNSALKGQMAVVIKKTLNADIPYVPWITGYIALFVGALMTFLVQSSSVFTSALTPLVGVGVISIERVYPLTLGSNIGTTTTALIAALATQGNKFRNSMQIALCHLVFNVTGILLFYPIPFMRFPIPLAKALGDITANYRWFAVVYMLLMFIILPLIVMGLSLAGSMYVITFLAFAVTLVVLVMCINFLQARYSEYLPQPLHSWDWLPRPLRSLEPYDNLITSCTCCKKLEASNISSQGNKKSGLVGKHNNNPVSLESGNVNNAFVE